jgi:hypothetical protein
MRLDRLTAHNDDIGEPIGSFYGTFIRELNTVDVELREIDNMQQRIRYHVGKEFPEVEVLAGETVVNNLIRRETTSEAQGVA